MPLQVFTSAIELSVCVRQGPGRKDDTLKLGNLRRVSKGLFYEVWAGVGKL